MKLKSIGFVVLSLVMGVGLAHGDPNTIIGQRNEKPIGTTPVHYFEIDFCFNPTDALTKSCCDKYPQKINPAGFKCCTGLGKAAGAFENIDSAQMDCCVKAVAEPGTKNAFSACSCLGEPPALACAAKDECDKATCKKPEAPVKTPQESIGLLRDGGPPTERLVINQLPFGVCVHEKVPNCPPPTASGCDGWPAWLKPCCEKNIGADNVMTPAEFKAALNDPQCQACSSNITVIATEGSTITICAPLISCCQSVTGIGKDIDINAMQNCIASITSPTCGGTPPPGETPPPTTPSGDTPLPADLSDPCAAILADSKSVVTRDDFSAFMKRYGVGMDGKATVAGFDNCAVVYSCGGAGCTIESVKTARADSGGCSLIR